MTKSFHLSAYKLFSSSFIEYNWPTALYMCTTWFDLHTSWNDYHNKFNEHALSYLIQNKRKKYFPCDDKS